MLLFTDILINFSKAKLALSFQANTKLLYYWKVQILVNILGQGLHIYKNTHFILIFKVS